MGGIGSAVVSRYRQALCGGMGRESRFKTTGVQVAYVRVTQRSRWLRFRSGNNSPKCLECLEALGSQIPMVGGKWELGSIDPKSGISAFTHGVRFKLPLTLRQV